LLFFELTHFVWNQTSSKRFKNKDIVNEFTISVAVNIAGLNILMN